jgi:DNA-binding LytR/AlgR family response regulator
MTKLILVIEDDIGLRSNIKFLLETKSYSVIQAANGAEGLVKYNECKPDLILCDITMPYVNGYEVLEKLRTGNEPFLTPFIFLTSKVEYKDARKGMELGADDYLFKPFDSVELLKAIQVRIDKYEIIKAELKLNKMASGMYCPTDKILFHERGHMISVPIEKIIYISAERQYTNVFVEGGKHFLLKRALNKWSDILPQNLFIRIHRSTIVNKNYIKKIKKGNSSSYKVYVDNAGTVLEVSRRFFKNLKNIF